MDQVETPTAGQLRRLAVVVLVLAGVAVASIMVTLLARGPLRMAAGLVAVSAVLAVVYTAAQSQITLQDAAEAATADLKACLEAEYAASERFGDVVAKAMPPLAELLTTRPDAQVNGRMNQFVSLLVGLAFEKCAKAAPGAPNVRCVVYGLSADGTTLTRFTWEGQVGDNPRLIFSHDASEYERLAVQFARGDLAEVVNVELPTKTYKCRAASPVNAGTVRYGLLVVDSDISDSLADADLKIVILLARCLAGAIAHLGRHVAEFPGHNSDTEGGGAPPVPGQYSPNGTTGIKESTNGKGSTDDGTGNQPAGRSTEDGRS